MINIAASLPNHMQTFEGRKIRIFGFEERPLFMLEDLGPIFKIPNITSNFRFNRKNCVILQNVPYLTECGLNTLFRFDFEIACRLRDFISTMIYELRTRDYIMLKNRVCRLERKLAIKNKRIGKLARKLTIQMKRIADAQPTRESEIPRLSDALANSSGLHPVITESNPPSEFKTPDAPSAPLPQKRKPAPDHPDEDLWGEDLMIRY